MKCIQFDTHLVSASALFWPDEEEWSLDTTVRVIHVVGVVFSLPVMSVERSKSRCSGFDAVIFVRVVVGLVEETYVPETKGKAGRLRLVTTGILESSECPNRNHEACLRSPSRCDT